MPRFPVCIEAKISAPTDEGARCTGVGAFVHLTETFNDDKAISTSGRVVVGRAVPVAVLAVLAEAGEAALALATESADQMKADGEYDGAKIERERAKRWRDALRYVRPLAR